MITPFVMAVFNKLAGEGAILDIVRSATPSPLPSLVDSFMEEAFKLDESMRAAYKEAKDADKSSPTSGGEASREEMFRQVFEQILEAVANGGTSSAKAVSQGNITHLMNMIRFLHRKQNGDKTREKKSVGLRAKLQNFREGLSKAETHESTARDVVEFVHNTFSAEISWLTNRYLWSRQRGGDLKTNLLVRDIGSKEKAIEQAEMTVFGMLLEGTRNSIEKELYRDKPTDAAALGAISAGVRHRIMSRETGDKYDVEMAATSGGKYPRMKWKQYIAPLLNADMFGRGESLDILAITEFLNENFLRKDLESGTSVDVPLPGGGNMTAPSFKTKLKNTKVSQWMTKGLPSVSIDMPATDEDSTTLGDTISAPSVPYEDTEQYFVDWLQEPTESDASKTNRDMIREKLREMVHVATDMAVAEKPGKAEKKQGDNWKGVTAANRDAIEDILLVKLGFMSSVPRRAEFKKKWLYEKDRKIPRFYAKPMDIDKWKDIGKPLKRIRGSKRKKTPYEEDWVQEKALIDKRTGHPPEGSIQVISLTKPFWEIAPVIHKMGEVPESSHLLEWFPYTRKDREMDIDKALNTYDADKWMEHTVNPDMRTELEQTNEPLSKIYGQFDPQKIFVTVAKQFDHDLIRPLGAAKPSVTPQEKTLSLNFSGIQPALKQVLRILGRLAQKDENIFRYLAFKRDAKTASMAAPRWCVPESLIADITNDLTEAA